MSTIVQKYGGSSLADLEKLKRVAEKIVATKRAGHDVVVVVSAMGDTTDELLDMAKALAPSPSRRELDMLLSVGERISMALVSMAIHAHGLEAISLTGSQCGIITTDSHSNARIMDVRPFRVQDALAKGQIVIVAGYQGTSYRREVTTLGRGGSDTTAVALAAALSAEACEIYSDVDGVFDADPRIVLSAEKLTSLTPDEMLEMARSGAKVLNEQAVEFARRSGIALYAKSTHQVDSTGTVIRPDGFDERARRAEAGRPSVAVSDLRAGLWVRAGVSADAVARKIEALDCAALDWRDASLSAVLLTSDIHDIEDLARSLGEVGSDVEVRSCSLVSVVGHGIGGQARWLRVATEALAQARVQPLDTFTSVARISFIVSEEELATAANALHEALVQ